MHLKKLKPFIRKMAKETTMTAQEIKAVNSALNPQINFIHEE
jgi:hypothetical protein